MYEGPQVQETNRCELGTRLQIQSGGASASHEEKMGGMLKQITNHSKFNKLLDRMKVVTFSASQL